MEEYLKYGAVLVIGALVASAATYSVTDQSDALADQGETIEELRTTVGDLEAQIGDLQEKVNEQAATIAEKEGEIEGLQEERDALREKIEATPDYRPVVEAESSTYVNYFPGAERNITVDVNVNEQIREQEPAKTYRVDYELSTPSAATVDSVKVYEGPEDTVREEVTDTTGTTPTGQDYVEFTADEEGTYYLEIDLTVDDLGSDAEEEQDLVDSGFTVETEADNDYYTVVR